MRFRSGVVGGNVPELSVCRLIAHRRAIFAALPAVLISAIDSETRPETIPWVERRIENLAGWLVAPPLFVSGQSLVDLADESVFNGFDEIWVPGDGPLPDAAPRLCLSSPPHFVGGAPGEASNVLAGGRWRLGLGDGDGLNFVASDLALVQALGLDTNR
ncbi:MAG: hypothetical protein U0Q22_18910 [Acidimicrobiales bacterium]